MAKISQNRPGEGATVRAIPQLAGIYCLYGCGKNFSNFFEAVSRHLRWGEIDPHFNSQWVYAEKNLTPPGVGRKWPIFAAIHLLCVEND